MSFSLGNEESSSWLSKYFSTINAPHFPFEIPDTTTHTLTKNQSLPDSKIIRLINGMQIEGFIPAKIAIVLKNEWHDTIFCKAILANIASDLRDRDVISLGLYENLYSKITSQEDQQNTLYILYAIMRFKEGSDVYKLDDLIKIPKKKLVEYVNTKELVQSKKYLETKIITLSRKHEELHDRFAALLDYLRNDNSADFKQALSQLFTIIAEKAGEGVERFIFEELAEACSCKSSFNNFIYTARILKGHDFYSEHLRSIHDISEGLSNDGQDLGPELFHEAKKAFSVARHILADAKNIPFASKTLFSLHHGLILSEWKKINAIFDSRKHTFCHCHASDSLQEGSMWPLNHGRYVTTSPTNYQDKGSNTIAILGCNWGGGHKQAASNAAEILERNGMHPHSIDIPLDMMAPYETAKAKTNKFSVDQIVNKLAQFRAFALLNLLRKLGGFNSVEPPPAKDKVKAALQRLLLINPQAAISTIPSQTAAAVKASELLGIPCSYIHTDVDRKIYNRDTPFTYEHCTAMLPYDESVMVPAVYDVEPTEKVVVVGPPTKYNFDEKAENHAIDTIRSQLEREIGATIPRGKKLVIISSGANGSFSPYPEMLAKKYKGKSANEIPFVAIVLCGKNNQKFLHHVQGVASQLPQGVMVAKEFVNQSVMEKLYKVASHGGAVIGKAGGMSIFELSKCGTRLLIDAIPSKMSSGQGFFGNLIALVNWIAHRVLRFKNYFAWEKINQDFAIRQGFASRVTTEVEFFAKFDEALSFSEPVKLGVQVKNFSEMLPVATRAMLDKADKDINLKARRQQIFDSKIAASLV